MHNHQAQGTEKRFILSIGLTFIIFIAEVIGGFWTGSLALLSDSAHVFMDVFALALSFLALRLSRRPSDDGHTYGYHRLEVLAALINGATLALIAVGIFREAIERWGNPQPVRSTEMLVIAVIGLVVNLVVAYVLGGHNHEHAHGHEHEHEHEHGASPRDLNLHSAFLHVVGDAVSSVGVILAAIVIGLTGWNWVDPAISILIGVLILFSGYQVLRASLHILVEGTPEGVSVRSVAEALGAVAGVQGVHDLHVWSICSGNVALSAHVVLRPEAESCVVLEQMQHCLVSRFGIGHTTIQFEGKPCEQLDCACGGGI